MTKKQNQTNPYPVCHSGIKHELQNQRYDAIPPKSSDLSLLAGTAVCV